MRVGERKRERSYCHGLCVCVPVFVGVDLYVFVGVVVVVWKAHA